MSKARILEKSKNHGMKVLDSIKNFTCAFGDSIQGKNNIMKNHELYSEIFDSIDDLEYFSIEKDKENLRNDFIYFKKDFRKATENAKSKVEYGETFTAKQTGKS